jgi:hypothetical protein
MRAAVALPDDDRRQMVQRARQHVVAHFNASVQLRSLAELIESRN